MTGFTLNPDFVIGDEEALRGLYDATHEVATLK